MLTEQVKMKKKKDNDKIKKVGPNVERLCPDGTPRIAASRLGLFCLPMSHKRDAGLFC